MGAIQELLDLLKKGPIVRVGFEKGSTNNFLLKIFGIGVALIVILRLSAK